MMVRHSKRSASQAPLSLTLGNTKQPESPVGLPERSKHRVSIKHGLGYLLLERRMSARLHPFGTKG